MRTLHLTCTSPRPRCRLNLVGPFGSDIATRRLRRGVLTRVAEWIAVIDEYIADHDSNPETFTWTKSAQGYRARQSMGLIEFSWACPDLPRCIDPRW